jgi:hypothetical protein
VWVASPFAREKRTVRVCSAIWHVGFEPLTLVLVAFSKGRSEKYWSRFI